jgi:hypothetical protein
VIGAPSRPGTYRWGWFLFCALRKVLATKYFGDHGVGPALLCLATWAGAGLGLLGAAGLRGTRRRADPKPQLKAGIPAAVAP